MQTINQLEEIKGDSNSSLITLIIPPNAGLWLVSKMLDNELKTANNIKNRSNRQSVVDSIKNMSYKLKSMNAIPENGIALFSGSTNLNSCI